jgi:hypothetical protein
MNLRQRIIEPIEKLPNAELAGRDLVERKDVLRIINAALDEPVSEEDVTLCANAINDVWDCPEEDDDRLLVYAKAAINAYLGRE